MLAQKAYFLIQALIQKLGFGAPGSRSRFEDSGHLAQKLHFLIQILIQELDFGAPGLQVQI